MKTKLLSLWLALLCCAISCSEKTCMNPHLGEYQGLPLVMKGSFPEKETVLNPGEVLSLSPEVISDTEVSYTWTLDGKKVSDRHSYSLKADSPSRMRLGLELTNASGTVCLENRITVTGDLGDGFYIINEGWYGHDNGSVSFYSTTDNKLTHNILAANNYGMHPGITTQSATLWKDKLYICSKQGTTLVVADPKTLYVEKVSEHLCGNLQTYEFIGVDETYGILTHNGYFSRIDLNTLETKTYRMTGNTWGGTGSGVLFNGKLILNVCGDRLYRIAPERLLDENPAYETLDVFTRGGTRFVEGKDGFLYTVESKRDKSNNLVRIGKDFTVEKKPLRADYSPSSFSTYSEDSFCGTPEGDFYYIAAGRIYHASWEQPCPDSPFVEKEPGMMLYGAGIRVNPANGELVATYVPDGTAEGREIYKGILVVRYDGKTGEKKGQAVDDTYLFPATILFRQ